MGKERAFRTGGRHETQGKANYSWKPGSLLGLLLSQTMAVRTTKETEVIDVVLVDLRLPKDWCNLNEGSRYLLNQMEEEAGSLSTLC